MLKFMRSHLSKTFLALIVAGIALVFVFMGVFPETRLGGGRSTVAKVGGEAISAQEFQQAVERSTQQYRAMGVEMQPQMLEYIQRDTLNQMVNSKLMLHEARRLGIAASDREVSEEIQRYPVFQDREKKTFDVNTYRQVLAQNGFTPGQFEQNVREDLINRRVMHFLESRIRVTPAEVQREFQLANETRELNFVRFSREDAMKKMTVTDKEVEAFLADKEKSPQVSSYYSQNSGRYNKPEQVCARHLLKRTMAPSERGQTEPPTAFAQLKPNAGNFAALANKHTEDPSGKGKGGDLGCFPRGAMDKAFEDTAFALSPGQVSKPVLSNFGWHYIYVYKKEPPVSRPLASVQKEIAEELIKRDRVEEIRKINLAMAEGALKQWPPAGATVESTGPFNSLEGNIPKIGRAEEILRAAFDPAAKIQTGPQLFEAQGAVIVAKVKDRKSADMAKLKEQEAIQERTLRERKMRAFLPAWMEDVRKRVNVTTYL